MSKSIVNILKYILFLAIGAGLLWLVFKDQDPVKMKNDLMQANWFWIFVSMSIGVFSIWLRAKRWQQMLKPMGYEPSAVNAFCSVTIGYMINYILPRAGEVSRCAMLFKSDDIPVEKSLGTVVTERVIDMLILLVLVFAAFILQYDRLMQLIQDLQAGSQSSGGGKLKYILIIGGVLMALSAAALYIFRNKIKSNKVYIKLLNVLKGFVGGLSSFSKVENKPLFIVYSLGIWVCYLMMMYTSFFSLPATSHLGLVESITIQAVGTFGYVVPVPGGLGAFHYFTSKALTIFNVAESDGNIYATLVHESQMLLYIIGGLVALMIMNNKISKR